MPSSTKLCVHCGIDCSNMRRFKDASGRYACANCYEAIRAQAARSTVPGTARNPESDGAIPLADEIGAGADGAACPHCGQNIESGRTVCPHCRFNTRTGKAPLPPGQLISRPCVQCGYDLKGLPPDAVCPECGTENEPAPLTLRPPSDRVDAIKPYASAFKVAAGGLIGLILARLIAGAPLMILWDVLGMIVLLPLALGAYYLFGHLWAGGFDQSVGMASANFLAVFAVSNAVAATFGLVPVPILGWLISVCTYIGMLMKMFDLEEWKDAIILALLLVIVQIAVLMGIAWVVAMF